ncbi:hypothetical protein DSECCO2_147640 [anaerobic digester metagenome]
MKTAIFHSVNAALYLFSEKVTLKIDAIHLGKNEGFSIMPPQLERQLKCHTGLFAYTDGYLFTHLHEDHYYKDGLLTALNVPNRPVVYGPGLSQSTALAKRDYTGLKCFTIGNTEVVAIETEHIGNNYSETPHESFFIKFEEETVFIAGDGYIDEKLIIKSAKYSISSINIAFFNPYQLVQPGCQDFIRKMSPGRVYLYHLPFPQDDVYNYWTIAKRIIKLYPKDLPKLEILSQMAWIDNRYPLSKKS